MRLTSDQLTAFESAQQADFGRRCAAFLRAAFPAATRALAAEALRAFIDAGATRARELGIRAERDVHRFVELQLVFGARFDQSPDTPWAGPLLAEGAVDGGTRLDLLFAAAVWQKLQPKGAGIAPAELRPGAVQLTHDALWRARPFLRRRRLSLGDFDRRERADWLAAYRTALLGVDPPVAGRDAPEHADAPRPPESLHAVGDPVAQVEPDVFRSVDILCWNDVTKAVAKSAACTAAFDHWLSDRLPPDERAASVTWQQLAARSRLPDDPGLSVRIAIRTTETVRQCGTPWAHAVELVQRPGAPVRAGTSVTAPDGRRWVFDWSATLDPYGPRVWTWEQWRAQEKRGA